MMDFEEAKRVLAAFEKESVQYVLVGSMAMAAHGLVRATRDIDIFVSPSPENVDRLKRALRTLFDDPSIDEISAADLAGAYPAIQYAPPDAAYSIDILARLGGAFSFEGLASEQILVDGIRVRTATARMLYEMKKDTVRPQDRLDAETLRLEFDEDGDWK
jgi:hypothetical protein